MSLGHLLYQAAWKEAKRLEGKGRKYVHQRFKEKLMEYGLSSKWADYALSQLEGVGTSKSLKRARSDIKDSIDLFFSNKRQKMSGPPALEGPDGIDKPLLITEEPHSEEPAVPMSKYTSYPLSRCCVDLGAFNPDMKNDKITNSDISDPYTFDSSAMLLSESTINKKKFVWFGDIAHDAYASGTAGASVVWTAAAQPNDIAINSVRQLDKYAAASGLIAYPTKQNDSNAPISDVNDGNQKVVIWDQYIEMQIKNTSSGVETNNESPLFMEIYLMQAKEDIYQILDTANTGVLASLTQGSFVSKYDSSGSGLSDSVAQPMTVAFSDSEFLKKFKIVDSKKCCLPPGQIGTLRIFAGKPQVLSYKYTTRTKFLNATGPTFRPVVMKKGEQRLLIIHHGGVGNYDSATNVSIEKSRMSIYAWMRYRIAMYGDDVNNSSRTTNYETDGTTADAEIDMHHGG